MHLILLDKLKMSAHKIAIIGLGYVGLPLAVEFGKKIPNRRLRY